MAWSQEQLRNAGLIYQVGKGMGMSTRDIQIGIITAMVESNLINVNYGDRDSLGLFQQRPSQGWGTPEQVTNPTYAATKFFNALKGLGDSRYTMGMGEAAQAVQRSAFPERYGQRVPDMRGIWPLIQKAGGDVPLDMDGVPINVTDEMSWQTPYQAYVPGQSVEAQQMGAPDAEMMLGAWGMNSPQAFDPDEFAFPLINGTTNTEVLTQIQGEWGAAGGKGFGKGVDGWRAAVIDAARTALGTPYTWGGNSLEGGVDCSGLIQQAFARAGLELPRVSFQQANFGKRVPLKALRPGDLVAWDNSSRNNGADHIALYLGNGQIIEAARPGTVVRIRNLGKNEGAWGVSLNF